MNEQEIHAIVKKQRAYFYTGATLNVDFRLAALKKLKTAIQKRQDEIHAAIQADLGKSAFESYMCETGLTLSEISYMLKHTRSFAREKRVPTPLAQFHSRSFTKPSPYGSVLIMSPWNYPFLLTIEPLVDAIAAGNTAVLKPSAYSPNTSAVIKELIEDCFPLEFVTVITGGRSENTCLLKEHFDYIFFTGSQAVGKDVMRQAAEHLTPVTLELGGKSPCLVDRTANLKLAARRIVFGQFLNCGQTCVAPDYIYCDPVIKDQLVEEIKKEIRRQFTGDPLSVSTYGKIINEKHFQRILKLMDPAKTVCGGSTLPEKLKIAPTVMDNVTFSDPVMQEEIFGPVLPVIAYDSIDEALAFVNSREHPLALYLFSENRALQKRVLASVPFGGGCINDTIVHLATSRMGFGGVGGSGMGSYHGRKSFDTFSHEKSILKKSAWIDMPVRYMPYTPLKTRLLRLFLR